MTFHRMTLVVFTTLFTAGMTSVASAGCCDWGFPAPVAYAPAPLYAAGGCGGCGPAIAATYAPPVVPAPIGVAAWDVGGCGCGGSLLYAAPPFVPPIAPAPIYVVNQGPDYTGPGIMVPFETWSPAAAWAPATDYPYVPGPGYGYGYGYGAPAYYRHRFYHRRHFAYRAHVHAQPQPYGARGWQLYPHRPLGARD